MPEPMDPAAVPNDVVRAALKQYCTHCSLTVGRQPISDHEEEARIILAGAMPLIQQQMREVVAAEVESHAESIGWYEAGGVWAEAIDVIKQEPWTRREVDGV